MKKLSVIEKLTYLFSKLPSIGSRSAKRIVLHLLEDKDVRIGSLIDALAEARDGTYICKRCNNIDVTALCSICSSNSRDKTKLTIVENVIDLWALEKSGVFDGVYYVLKTNMMNIGKGNVDQEEELGISNIKNICIENNVQEIILATNSTLDGQTLAYMIIEYFKDESIKITKLASGIPIGGELDYLDEGTIGAAMNRRDDF